MAGYYAVGLLFTEVCNGAWFSDDLLNLLNPATGLALFSDEGATGLCYCSFDVNLSTFYYLYTF